jgi:hypothetical protein
MYRLEKEIYTILWIKGGQARDLIAQTVHKMFPEGVGVCSDTCRLMGFVNPRGGVREVPQPWPEYPIHVMANNPRPEIGSDEECPCFGFLDPEVGGPWRERGLNQHHPFCMYEKGAGRRYEHFCKTAQYGIILVDGKYHRRQIRTLQPTRPDAWFKSLKEIP